MAIAIRERRRPSGRVPDGHPEAVAAVVERYYRSLLNFAHRLGCSREDAEDVTQDALLKAARGLDRYEHRDRFRSWLFSILANTARDHLKKAWVRKEVVSDVEILADRAAYAPYPEEATVLDSIGGAVREAVAAILFLVTGLARAPAESSAVLRAIAGPEALTPAVFAFLVAFAAPMILVIMPSRSR